MASYSRILLCYNATREGRRALRQGAMLARDLGAETHLLAVLDHLAWVKDWVKDYEAPMDICACEHQTAREVLQQGVADLTSLGVFASGHLTIGDPMEQIPSYAEQFNVDLIVLGHHKRDRWWTRNTDSLLLDRVRCSVIVVIDNG